jgi:hypothetical protein
MQPLLAALATCVKPLLAPTLHRALPHIVAPLAALMRPLSTMPSASPASPPTGLSAQLLATWSAVLDALLARCDLPLNDHWLSRLTPALEEAFASDVFASVTVPFWERAFARATSLTYAPALVLVLQALRRRAPITLPGLPELDTPHGSQTLSHTDSVEAPTARPPVLSALRGASPPLPMPLSPFKRAAAMVAAAAASRPPASPVAASPAKGSPVTPSKRRLSTCDADSVVGADPRRLTCAADRFR